MDQETALKDLEKILHELLLTSMGRRAFLASTGLLLASCASTPKTRYREGDNIGQDINVTFDDEKRMTEKVLPEMRKQYPPVQNAELQSYIGDLGHKIVLANSLRRNPYEYSFTVVDVPYVNAFALPAGTVFVTSPLIQMAETEAELAGVIGHEIGHIKARHTAERIAKMEKEKTKSLWYAVGGGVLGGALGYGLGQLTCAPRDRKCLARAAELGAVAGVGGGLLIQKFAFMANSREDEMEADRIGFRTATQAGFSKDHVGLFYAKLLKMEQESKRKQSPLLASVADAMSTHPPSKERVGQMQQMVSESQHQASPLVSSMRFEAVKKVAAHYGKAKATN